MNIQQYYTGFVVALMLGDGSFHKRNGCIELTHTVPQLPYLKFKIGLAEQLGCTCKVFNLTKKRSNLGVFDYCSGTIRGEGIRELYQYPLEDRIGLLNPLGLLIWWLDDGCLSIHQKQNGSISRFGYLNTQRFSLEENQSISNGLRVLFGIETTIHIDSKSGFAKKDHYRLYLNATNMQRLIDHVRVFIPWIPNSMKYKFNMQYVVNRRKDSLEMAMRYNF